MSARPSVPASVVTVHFEVSGSLTWRSAAPLGRDVVGVMGYVSNATARGWLRIARLSERGEVRSLTEPVVVPGTVWCVAAPLGLDAVLLGVGTRDDAAGLAYVRWYRCAARGRDELHVVPMGTWDVWPIPLLHVPILDPVEDATHVLAVITKSTDGVGTRLHFGACEVCHGAIEVPPTTGLAPAEIGHDIGAIWSAATRTWAVVYSVGGFKRIEFVLWKPGTTPTTPVVINAAPARAGGVSSPGLIPRLDGSLLLLWRRYNGKIKRDTRDGGIWYVVLDPTGHATVKPQRWCDDRVVPAGYPVVLRHEPYYGSVLWQDGVGRATARARWAIVNPRDTTLPATPTVLGPCRPSHVVRTPVGHVVLTTEFTADPYRWAVVAAFASDASR